MDQDVEVPETPEPQFSVYLLEIIKKAQSEHGVLNNDYARYRRYCAHRARRLHKSLKFLHGSNKRFQKRTLDAKAITDERHFHIPLINAERAWAYAQELKVDLSTDRHYFSRKFTHMHRRFRKAALAARELARLASERCDSRTWVEAEGYAAWMHGQYLVEREQQLERAHRLLSRARAIFAKVSTIGSAAQQKACRQLEQEISTGLRTCEYRMERAKPGVRAEAVEAMPDPELSEAQLGDILDGLKADPAAETQEEQTVTIHVWRGEEHEVRDACVAKHVEAANQQLREVEASMDTDDVDIRLAHYTKAIGSLVAAAAAAEQALAAAGPGSAVAPEELIQLKAALEGACVDVTIARHTVAATDSEARFHRAKEQQLAASSKVKAAGKRGQPEELVRLFEMLTKEAQKMDRVGNGLYGTFAEEVLAESAFQVTHFSAARALYVGHHLLSVGKPVPAYGMFERCLHRCEEAAEKFEELQELAKVRAAVLEEEGSGHLPSLLAAAQQLQSHHAHLVQVQMRAQAFRVVARAEQAARTEHTTAKTADHLHRLALEPGAAVPGKSGYLLDTLQEWESNAGSGGKQVRVARTLPQPELVPARPIALDAALAYIQQPDLAQYRPHKEEAASLFNRAAGFFGWGTKK